MQMTTLLFLLKASVCNSEPLTITQTALLPQGVPISNMITLKSARISVSDPFTLPIKVL